MYPVWKPRQYTINYYSRGTSLGTETYTFGTDHELKSGHTWYAPGDYETTITALNSKDFGDKIFYAKAGNTVTIVFGNETRAVEYGVSTVIPEPGTGYKWVGIKGTNKTLDYYELIENSGITELVCDSDMFFELQPK